MSQLSHLLETARCGNKQAAAEILPIVYEELRQLARKRMQNESPGQTLSATALVHEAFLKLVHNGDQLRWDSKGHFFAAASIAMRRILIDVAKRKKRVRHGGGRKRATLDSVAIPIDDIQSDQVLDIDKALVDLESLRPEVAQLVHLRYYGGLSIEDAAKALGVSERTAFRHWKFAKAWMYERVNEEK